MDPLIIFHMSLFSPIEILSSELRHGSNIPLLHNGIAKKASMMRTYLFRYSHTIRHCLYSYLPPPPRSYIISHLPFTCTPTHFIRPHPLLHPHPPTPTTHPHPSNHLRQLYQFDLPSSSHRLPHVSVASYGQSSPGSVLMYS